MLLHELDWGATLAEPLVGTFGCQQQPCSKQGCRWHHWRQASWSAAVHLLEFQQLTTAFGLTFAAGKMRAVRNTSTRGHLSSQKVSCAPWVPKRFIKMPSAPPTAFNSPSSFVHLTSRVGGPEACCHADAGIALPSTPVPNMPHVSVKRQLY